MKILVIDDEQSLLQLLKLSLSKVGHQVTTSANGTIGIQEAKADIFDAILCDIGLPDMDGLDVLQELKSIQPETPVIIITAHGSVQSAITAIKRGAYDYVQKPFEVEEIEIVLEKASQQKKLTDDYLRLKKVVDSAYDFSNIIGNSEPLQTVFQKIKKAADTKSTVLILGESGTGKELLARAIHFNSNRKEKPFVVIDCGAIPANLLESELFGHLKGAFTGADRPKKGLCEEADGGTLFLDEIGELPIELQSKLLRLLQESTIRRVGDTKPIHVDIRIVAATHRNLEAAIQEGKFREDLFYRLNVVPLRSPNLRERKDDIPLLAHHFLKKYSKEYQRAAKRMSPLVIEKFLAYDWPGNIRQLQNLIEQMVVMSEGEEISTELLPPPFNSNPEISPPQVPESEWDLKKALERVQSYTEECMIRKALGHTKNNKTKAAQLLGISRRALIYKAQEYHLAVPEIPEAEGDLD